MIMNRSGLQGILSRSVACVVALFALSCGGHIREAVPSIGHHSARTELDSSCYPGYYPRIVDSLRVENLYDEARWRMYCLGCCDTARLLQEYDGLAKRPFGFLNLKFTRLHLRRGDSTEFYFMFYYNDTIRCDNGSTSADYGILPDGVGFSNNGKRIYYSWDIALGFNRGDDPTDPLQHPLQPKVVSFIKNNRDSLNPWFKNEAIKRGVLK
jgi:hypothetical protein